MLEKMHVNAALDYFMNLFSAVCDKHAPIKKLTVRSLKAPWLDEELRNLMRERDLLKRSAIMSGNVADWQAYRSLRNIITKFIFKLIKNITIILNLRSAMETVKNFGEYLMMLWAEVKWPKHLHLLN